MSLFRTEPGFGAFIYGHGHDNNHLESSNNIFFRRCVMACLVWGAKTNPKEAGPENGILVREEELPKGCIGVLVR